MGKKVKLLRGTDEKLMDSNVRLNFGDGQIVYDTTNEEPNFFLDQDGILTRFKMEDDDSLLPGQGSDVSFGGGPPGQSGGPINVLFWSVYSGGSYDIGQVCQFMQAFNDSIADDPDQGAPYSSDSTFQHMFSLGGSGGMNSDTLQAFISDSPYIGDNGLSSFGAGGPWDVIVMGGSNTATNANDQAALQHIINNRIPLITMMYGHSSWGFYNIPIPLVDAPGPDIDYRISTAGDYTSSNIGTWILNDDQRIDGLESFTKGILGESEMDQWFTGHFAINSNFNVIEPPAGGDKYGSYGHYYGGKQMNILNWVKYSDYLQPEGNNRLMRRVDLNYYHGGSWVVVTNEGHLSIESNYYIMKRLLLNSIYWCADRLPDPTNAIVI
jgi:hypothetical protein